MARSFTTCCTILLALAACGDDGGPSVAVTDAALTDGADATTSDTGVDVLDAVEVDILYPGYLCGDDESCSTGLCYGTATSQGFFEPAKCQTRCLEIFDYLHYCDSDDDCCRGKCCKDCGPQEGLCLLD
ncbi:MAG: hypothetical protein IT385_07005 [Deltaproteobacteria bacterium]|nr:hypothetical protein [Deltaproteobacteria bacterium]